MTKTLLTHAWIVALAAGASACTVYQPHDIAPTTAPTLSRAFKEVGPVRGESCQNRVFGFAISDGGRLYDARNAALANADADALIDVTADVDATDYLVFRRQCIVVEGKAIKFTN